MPVRTSPSLSSIYSRIQWLEHFEPDFLQRPLNQWEAKWLDLHGRHRDAVRAQEDAEDLVQEMKSLWYGSLHEASQQHGLIPIDQLPICPSGSEGYGPKHFRQEKLLVRQTLRALANEVVLARPRPRRLHLLDLPDELLRQICETFSPNPDDLDTTGTSVNAGDARENQKTIRHLRLTCWKFLYASSHLYVHSVDVDMHPRSLDRFQKITSHPLISKGLRAVRVGLHYYSSYIAVSPLEFAERAIDKLERYLQREEIWFSDVRHDDLERVGMTRDSVRLSLQEGKSVLDEWKELTETMIRRSQDDTEFGYSERSIASMLLRSRHSGRRLPSRDLMRAHQLYKEKYAAQQEMIASGGFIKAIVAGMSKAPTCRKVYVGDRFRFSINQHGRKPFGEVVWDPYYLATYSAVRPHSWNQVYALDCDDLPTQVLVDLMIAVLGSGFPIDHLGLEFTMDNELRMPITQSQLTQLRVHSWGMRGFEFSCHECIKYEPSDEEEAVLPTLDCLAAACMGSESLKVLKLTFECKCGDGFEHGVPTSLHHAFNSLRFPALRLVVLKGMTLSVNSLQRFLGSMPTNNVSVELDNLELCGGSWHRALDVMRNHQSMGKRFARFRRGRGEECVDMNEIQRLVLWGIGSSSDSEDMLQFGWANCYLFRTGLLQDVNPFSHLDDVKYDYDEEEEEEDDDEGWADHDPQPVEEVNEGEPD